MSINHGTDVEDGPFPESTNYNGLDTLSLTAANDNPQTAPDCGTTSPVIENQGPSNHFIVHNQKNNNDFYRVDNSVFNQPLVLLKELRSPCDIHYKTDYFPLQGKNAGKSQSPRYVRTVDGGRDIIIKFPLGFNTIQNPGDYLLEISLITTSHLNNQHFMHVNKFQLDHKNSQALDYNPYFVRLSPKHCQDGQIEVKLVIVKTRLNDLINVASLPLFNTQALSDLPTNCQTIEELETTYQLSHARIVFSLGFMNPNTNQFDRYPGTTVISNEIVEKKKPKPSDDISCPRCSHTFSIREQKQTSKKRLTTSSDSPKKKRSPRQKVSNT